MFKTLAGVALVSAVFTAPALAQGRETEFGADVTIRWMKPSGGDALFHIQTPVDLRVAFHGAGRFAVEARLVALFLSASGHNAYGIDPGLNLLFGLPGSTHHNGAYVTAGADLAIAGGTGVSSESIVSFNAGIGLRRPMGKASSRAEVFVGYTPEKASAHQPKTVSVGARLGISFFN